MFFDLTDLKLSKWFGSKLKGNTRSTRRTLSRLYWFFCDLYNFTGLYHGIRKFCWVP